jgi:tetratricopeptide (TPR) repeat protein
VTPPHTVVSFLPACALALACSLLPAAAQEKPAAPREVHPVPTPGTSSEEVGAQLALPFGIMTEARPGAPARAAALLMSGQQGGSILVSALAEPLAVDDSGTTLAIAVDIDGPSLMGSQTTGPLPVEVTAYAIQTQGGVSGHFTQVFTLDAARAVPVVGRGGIKVVGTLRVVPGPHLLRVLVRNVRSSAFGLMEVPLPALPARHDQPFAGVPVVAEPEGTWVLARERTTGDKEEAYPFLFWGSALLPSTRPVLREEMPVTAWVVARGLSLDGVVVRVRDTEGEVMGEVPAQVTTSDASGVASGTTVLQVGFTLPRLYPGRYTLALAPAGGADAAALTPPLDFLVVGSDVGARPLSWAQLRSLPAPADTAAQQRITATRGKTPPPRQLERAYRQAIDKLVTSGPAAAGAAVTNIETRSAAVGTTRAMADLVAAEVEVAEELARARPENVLALFLLHVDLFHTYGKRRQYVLQAYSRRTLEELIGVAERTEQDPASRALTADAVAVLGCELQHAGLTDSAQRFHARALELDPANEVALMGLAAGYERTGRYAEAVQALEEVIRVDPDDAEARIRLAVNLDRVSTGRRAREAFARCLGPDNPSWVRAIAYQELAENLVEEEHFTEARQLLDEATATLPGNQRLALQLAYVLDRLGEPVAARKVVDSIAAGVPRDEESPRFRYSEWPRDVLAAARRRLAGGFARAIDSLKKTEAETTPRGAR